MGNVMTRGVLYIHSATAALCSHLEWALSAVNVEHTKFEWVDQPAMPGMLRTEILWRGEQGSAAKIASAIHNWGHLRFEVVEEPSQGSDGARYSYTPDLGIFHATTDVHGNIMVSEDRIRFAYEQAAGDPALVYRELSLALGEAWDEELEPFRHAGEGAPVRWLHQVG